jgi:CRP-like cAMP-binding protein
MVGVRLIAAISSALAAARRKVRELALKRAEGRLAELLLQLIEGGSEPAIKGTRIALGYSRRELAEMIGVSTETAIRLLGKLKQKHVIATDHRDVIVTDPVRLARIASHDNGA